MRKSQLFDNSLLINYLFGGKKILKGERKNIKSIILHFHTVRADISVVTVSESLSVATFRSRTSIRFHRATRAALFHPSLLSADESWLGDPRRVEHE